MLPSEIKENQNAAVKKPRHLPFKNAMPAWENMKGKNKKQVKSNMAGASGSDVTLESEDFVLSVSDLLDAKNSEACDSNEVPSDVPLSIASTRRKQSPIVLPKKQFDILQERIKSEIENLQCLEVTDEKGKEKAEEENNDDDDDDDLGSDIQYLPEPERRKRMLKNTKVATSSRTDESRVKRSQKSKSKSLKTKLNKLLAMEEEQANVITIDLTKENSPQPETEVVKTDYEVADTYAVLDLDYGAKIDWGDNEPNEKKTDTKHSSTKETALVNVNIDQSKLTSETSKKITDIKNRIARSISIGLSNKEEQSSKSEKKQGDIPNSRTESACDPSESGDDAEAAELANLRCTSERAEVVAEREKRRRRRCADYPGFAFGSSMFSSDTMMKFSIIRNELHNIMNTQLKRVCKLFCFC